MLKAALGYAARGWPVLPVYGIGEDGDCECGQPFCSSPGKHPRVAGGARAASADPDQVRLWWTNWPAANVAVATGRAANLTVVDLDTGTDADGWDGEMHFESWQTGRAEAPDTLRQRTGSGGAQLFYEWVEGSRNAVAWLPSVDVKTEGGYVLLPPSRHVSGNVYAWENELPVAPAGPLAPWLREARGSKSGGKSRGEAPDYRPYDFKLAREVGPARGHRDQFFNDYAYSMCMARIPRDEAREAMRRVWEKTDHDGFPWSDAEYKLDHVYGSVTPPPHEAATHWDPRARDASTGRDEAARRALLGDPERPAVDDETLDEEGNGRRLVNKWSNVLRHSNQLGWMIFDGSRWEPDTKDRVMRAMQMVLSEQLRALAASSANDTDRQRVVAWLERSRQTRTIKLSVENAQWQPEIKADASEFDRHKMLLPCPNGTVDLATGELRPADAADLMTKSCATPFEPGADVRGPWPEFVASVTKDAETEAWLRRAAGYTLTGSTAEELFFIVFGPAASGKSTFLVALQTALGGWATTLEQSFLAFKRGGAESYPETTVAQLRGRRLLAASEVSEGVRFDETLIKKLSGGDYMTGRMLYQSAFQFRPDGKLWIGTNHRPVIRDQYIWRRIRAVPFPHSFEGAPDRRLKGWASDPRSELCQGALAWAVRGAAEWRAALDESGAGGVGWCPAVRAATAEYKTEQDVFGRFVDEQLDTTDPTAFTLTKDVLGRYEAWLREHREFVPAQLTTSALGRRLSERGLGQSSRTRAGMGFRGLKLAAWDGGPEPATAWIPGGTA